MATMFPDEVADFTTAGERKVYDFLRRAARPDGMFLVWYSPDIEAREPDFILYSPDSGLIVLEVKDWIGAQILELDPKSALLRIGGIEERRKQPLAQAREYVNSLLSLLGKNLKPSEKIPCPVTWGAVFPHITREEFEKCQLSAVMDGRRILCADEIAENSHYGKDASGQTFRKWMLEKFPPLFPFKLTAGQITWLRGCIFPVARLELPHRGGQKQSQAILALDHDQENLARNLGFGKLLVTGPAGSGKTVILAHQAWHLPRVMKIRRILITCFNLSLVGYIRRLVARKGASLGPEGVEALPFYSLCEKILGEKLAHASEDGDYYKLVVSEALERLRGEHPLKGHWDAILVDEGQDFTPDMAKVIHALAPKADIWTIFEDGNQRLYQNNPDVWEKEFAGELKKRRLDCQYRNTKRIAALAAKALGEEPRDRELGGGRGEEPEWLLIADPADLVAAAAEKVAALARGGVPLSEIAVLYISGKSGDGANLPESLVEALEARGVLARWAARDAASKRSYDITTDSVTVTTAHSAKGLDYGHVFLFGLDRLDPGRDFDRRLAHVGITRARECLTICIDRLSGMAAILKKQ